MDQFINYAFKYTVVIIQLIVFILIVKAILGKNLEQYHSNWNTLIEDFKFPRDEFYERVITELKNKGIKYVGFKTVYLNTGLPLGARTAYLRIRWGEYKYYVCAKDFAKGYFISWWLIKRNSVGKILISKIPFFGKLLADKLYPITFYKHDAASMFMSYAQSCVTKVLEDITTEKGITLDLENQKPILNDVFIR